MIALSEACQVLGWAGFQFCPVAGLVHLPNQRLVFFSLNIIKLRRLILMVRWPGTHERVGSQSLFWPFFRKCRRFVYWFDALRLKNGLKTHTLDFQFLCFPVVGVGSLCFYDQNAVL